MKPAAWRVFFADCLEKMGGSQARAAILWKNFIIKLY